MSPICQTFVQNSWKSDLCSNCFRSKDDHESSGKQTFSNGNYGSGSLSRRYVGVAGRSGYSRQYYGMNTWNSILDRESDYLKSPGLIKGMDNLIKESEKNQLRKEAQTEEKTENYNNANISTAKNLWLLSNYNQSLPSKRESLQKEDSADLGSDAGSHDTSASSSIDSTSLDYESPTKLELALPASIDSNMNQISDKEPLGVVQGIMRSYERRNGEMRSISFNSDEEVIGYGGDVDYSDDDGSFIDDDDDDDDMSVNSCDLSPDERVLRRLTEKNTDFNSENENLMESVNKFDDCSEDSSSAREESKNRNCRQDNKIKLKRSQPHVTVKPNLKPQLSITDETVDSNKGVDALEILLKGIKPKFVSKDEEMVEKTVNTEIEDFKSLKRTTTKVTSIDDIIREALINQVERKQDKKTELETQFSSLDVMQCDEKPKLISEIIQKPKRSIKSQCSKNENKSTPSDTKPSIYKNTNIFSKSIDKISECKLAKSKTDQYECKTVTPQILIQRRCSFLESQLGLDQTEVKDCNSKKMVHETISKVESTDISGLRNETPKQTLEINTDSEKCPVKLPEITPAGSAATGTVGITKYSVKPKLNDCCNEITNVTDTGTAVNIKEKFSTFGRKMTSQNGPQMSFLHSDFLKSNGKVCSSSEFLQHISSPSDTVTHTAGIQKSALHNSTSSVKGLLNTKPFVSLRAFNPKDKPAIPPKTGIKFNLGRPVSVPTVNKPEVINGNETCNKNDIIYAVPSVTPVCAISPTSSSSGYSTTSNVSLLSTKYGNENVSDHMVKEPNETTVPEVNTEKIDYKEQGHMIEAIDNSSQHTYKRVAPQPPFEDIPLDDYQPPTKIKTSPLNQPALRYHMQPSYLQKPISDSQDFDSYSSFTDDFDDDEEEYPESETAKPVNRSSSVTPSYRNSMGITDNQQNEVSYKPAEFGVGFDDGPVKYPATRSHSVPRSVESSVKAVRLDKKKSESSRFGFVKATFFKPSSPNSMKRKISFERSRDRSKKSSSGFSFKKFLRLGSSDKSKQNKSQKDQEKQAEREMKKQKLQIVHPLDYNKTGVEVIARPELTSPIQNCVPEMFSPSIPNSVISATTNIIDTVHRSESREMDLPSLESLPQHKDLPKNNSFGAIPQNDVSMRHKNKQLAGNLQNLEKSEVVMEKKTSFLKKKNKQDKRTSANLPPTGLPERSASSIQISNSKLGCNSEGRPKPPPPPRKTSLEASSDSSSHGEDRHSEISSRHSSDSESSLRRQLQPRRITNSSIHNSIKPSLYANLGDVRAPFTPRKPFRSSSIKDIEKEKRKAPLPPRHSSKSRLNGIEAKNQNAKSSAPPVPMSTYTSNDSHSPTDSSSDVEKMKSQTNRTSSLPNLSDINAEVLAQSNFESLSNLLDEISNSHYSKESHSTLCKISSWKDMELITSDPTFCGPRVLYEGKVAGTKVVVMFSSENKIEVDSLLMPVPLHTFKEEVPASLFGSRRKPTSNYIQASIWILPNMSLSSLEEFSHFSQRVLERDPLKWEKRLCLLLLQLVTALKHLQAKGIEETSLDRILISELTGEDGDRNVSSRLMLVSPSAEHSDHLMDGISLCQCAAAVTMLLLGNGNSCGSSSGPVLSPPFAPRPYAFVAFVATLREERASSLTKAKCILEAILYGPSEVKPFIENGSDQLIQGWLDNERMNLLAHIGSDKREVFHTLLTKFQLLFVVRTNTKSLKESLIALEAPDVTNF